MKIYISGPITEAEGGNQTLFAEAQTMLESFGHEALNPHDLFEGIDHSGYTHDDYMKPCIKALIDCDCVVTLDGWMNSKGAQMEVDIARRMGKKIYSIFNVERNKEINLHLA